MNRSIKSTSQNINSSSPKKYVIVISNHTLNNPVLYILDIIILIKRPKIRRAIVAHPFFSLVYIFRIDQKVLSVFTGMFKLFISTEGFSHIERIFAFVRHTRGIVAVIINYASEDGVSEKHGKENMKLARSNKDDGSSRAERYNVPHPFIHPHRNRIARSHI